MYTCTLYNNYSKRAARPVILYLALPPSEKIDAMPRVTKSQEIIPIKWYFGTNLYILFLVSGWLRNGLYVMGLSHFRSYSHLKAISRTTAGVESRKARAK